jgi:alpha-1,2-mannosyltransferase
MRATHHVPLGRRRLLALAAWVMVAAFGVLGLLDAAWLIVTGDHAVVDFRVFYGAAEAIRDGGELYPGLGDRMLAQGVAYVYAPLTALLVLPATLLPVGVAEVCWLVLMIVAAVGTLWLLDVRDWRCYVVALFWMPVVSAIQVGNVSLILALLAACAWRLRDRPRQSGVSLGAALAAKTLMWPLLAWMIATRRMAATVYAGLFGLILVLGSWAVVGFEGLLGYPTSLPQRSF